MWPIQIEVERVSMQETVRITVSSRKNIEPCSVIVTVRFERDIEVG